MTLTSFNGGESPYAWDNSSGSIIDAEGAAGSTGNAIVAGALRTGSKGSYHQLMDMSVSGANTEFTTKSVAANGAGQTICVAHMVAQIDNVTGDGTTYDDICVSCADSILVCYARKTDGKLHLLVERLGVNGVANNGAGKARFTVVSTSGYTNGDTVFCDGFGVAGYNGFTTITVITATTFDTTFTFSANSTGHYSWEVNPAAAFTPVFGSAFGLRLEMGTAAPYLCELYYDATAGGTFVKEQSGNAPQATTAFSKVTLGKNLGKGNNHNWKFSTDDVYTQDNGGSFNTTLVREYRDVVIARRPTTGTQTYNDANIYQNTGGTVCTTAMCYTDVSDNSDLTYVAFVGDPSHVGGLVFTHITFPTTGTLPGAADTVYAALLSARGIDASVNHGASYACGWAFNGSVENLTSTYHPGTSTVGWAGADGRERAPDASAWTAASLQQTQIGLAMPVGSTTVYNVQFTELYLIILFKPFPDGWMVPTNQPIFEKTDVVAY